MEDNFRPVDQQAVREILGFYTPGFRYLQSAETGFPRARGIFKINATEYVEQLDHLTEIEAQLCVNQLCYVFFGVEAAAGRWAAEGMNKDSFFRLRKEGMFITASEKKFRRQIKPGSEFLGILSLQKIKKISSGHLAKLSFSFDGDACVGSLNLALVTT